MPYALIPDGYSLKKVTKLQKVAVNEKRRHDDVVALLNNENTPLVVGGAIAAIVTGLFAQQLAEDFNLDEDQVKETLKTALFSATGLSGVLLKKLTELDIGELDFFEPRGLA